MDSKKSNFTSFDMGYFFKTFIEDKYIIILKIKDIGLNKLFYNHKMPTSAELLEILKENEKRVIFLLHQIKTYWFVI